MPIMALTATATEKVQADILSTLKMKKADVFKVREACDAPVWGPRASWCDSKGVAGSPALVTQHLSHCVAAAYLTAFLTARLPRPLHTSVASLDTSCIPAPSSPSHHSP